MAISDGDATILVNFNQTDEWTLTHVLLFYFIMWNGFDWYWAVIIAYIWKGYEATAWGGFIASPPDALIVDPLQACMAIVVFLLLRHYNLARVSTPMPRLRADAPTQQWLVKMLYFLVALLAHQQGVPETFAGQKWIVCLSIMFAVNVMYDQQTYRCAWRETLSFAWAPLLYVAAFTIYFFAVSAVPYNPFYASLWFHIPAFTAQAWLVASPRLRSRAPRAASARREEQQAELARAVPESLLPPRSLFAVVI